MNGDCRTVRQEYGVQGELSRSDMLEDPMEMFERWYINTEEIAERNAMNLSTQSSDGRLRSRMVLLKLFDAKGFLFFTNYGSQKAKDIETNNHVNIHFFWKELSRQVSISGRAEKVSTAESASYFAMRPRGSQLGAWVSDQSSVVSSKSVLLNKWDGLKKKFLSNDIECPSFWGGYRVVPELIEFWQGGADRLHDRFLYTKTEDQKWSLDRLSP